MVFIEAPAGNCKRGNFSQFLSFYLSWTVLAKLKAQFVLRLHFPRTNNFGMLGIAINMRLTSELGTLHWEFLLVFLGTLGSFFQSALV